jgi:hypothetical protein
MVGDKVKFVKEFVGWRIKGRDGGVESWTMSWTRLIEGVEISRAL